MIGTSGSYLVERGCRLTRLSTNVVDENSTSVAMVKSGSISVPEITDAEPVVQAGEMENEQNAVHRDR